MILGRAQKGSIFLRLYYLCSLWRLKSLQKFSETWCAEKLHKMSKLGRGGGAIKGEHEQTRCLHIPALVRASNTVLCPPPLSYNIVKRWQPLPLRSCHTETNSYRLAGERKEESCLSAKLFLDLNSSASSARLLKIGYGFQKHPDTLARNCLCEELSERQFDRNLFWAISQPMNIETQPNKFI